MVLSAPFLEWLGDQLHLSPSRLLGYASRGATRAAHQALAMQHLDLTPFTKTHMALAEDIATKAAFATDHGVKIVEDCRGTRCGTPQASPGVTER